MSTLSDYQLSRMRNGHPVQLRADQILGSGLVFERLHPANVRKINSAFNRNRGVRISLSGEELAAQRDVEGGSLWKKIGIAKQVKSATKAVSGARKNTAKILKRAGVLSVAERALDEGIKASVLAAATTVGATPAAFPIGEIAADRINIAPRGAGIGRSFNRLGRKINKGFQPVRNIAKQIGVKKELHEIEQALKRESKGFLKDVMNEVRDNIVKRKSNDMQGEGFASLRGSGFALTGGAVTPYGSSLMMLNPQHPAISHPLPPRRGSGYRDCLAE